MEAQFDSWLHGKKESGMQEAMRRSWGDFQKEVVQKRAASRGGIYNNIVGYLKLKEIPGNFSAAVCVKMRRAADNKMRNSGIDIRRSGIYL